MNPTNARTQRTPPRLYANIGKAKKDSIILSNKDDRKSIIITPLESR